MTGGDSIKKQAKLALVLTLTAICLFGQLAVPGLVCAQAYADSGQSDLAMGFAFDVNNSAVLLIRLEQTRGIIRVSGESVSGADPHPMAWTHHDPVPLPGLDVPVAFKIRRIMPPHSILGPPRHGCPISCINNNIRKVRIMP